MSCLLLEFPNYRNGQELLVNFTHIVNELIIIKQVHRLLHDFNAKLV